MQLQPEFVVCIVAVPNQYRFARVGVVISNSVEISTTNLPQCKSLSSNLLPVKCTNNVTELRTGPRTISPTDDGLVCPNRPWSVVQTPDCGPLRREQFRGFFKILPH